jgi:hypothetical protein
MQSFNGTGLGQDPEVTWTEADETLLPPTMQSVNKGTVR